MIDHFVLERLDNGVPVQPGLIPGAVVLTRPEVASGRTVAIVSGGNVEPSLLVRVLSEYAT